MNILGICIGIGISAIIGLSIGKILLNEYHEGVVGEKKGDE